MNNKIEFSVIVACYNPDLEKLKKTINSVVSQKNVRFEIVLADDGSRLNYKNELADYFREIDFLNYKFSFLHENAGTVCNILEGVKISDADYIKIISPGDYFYDENSLAEYLRAFRVQKADLVFSRAQYFTPQYELLPRSAPENTVVFHNRFLKRNIVSYHDYVLGATIAAKREIFDYLTPLVGKVRYLEDVPLTFLSLLNRKKVYAVNKKLIWYEYGYGISSNLSTSKLLNHDYAAFFDYLKENYRRQSKLSIKFFHLNQLHGKWKRFIKKLFVSPVFGLYMIRKKLSKNKIAKNEIAALRKITELTV